MATYQVKYTLADKTWEYQVTDVMNENTAVLVCDIEHPEVPREASVNVSLVCE